MTLLLLLPSWLTDELAKSGRQRSVFYSRRFLRIRYKNGLQNRDGFAGHL
ncbi:MAG: hypothetical protein ACOYYS_15725 [Chloroflexota bacterium]